MPCPGHVSGGQQTNKQTNKQNKQNKQNKTKQTKQNKQNKPNKPNKPNKQNKQVGHIFSLTFANADRRRPETFFSADTVKAIDKGGASDKVRIVDHLRGEARDASFLCLWLDCDREGENIAHEVIAITVSKQMIVCNMCVSTLYKAHNTPTTEIKFPIE